MADDKDTIKPIDASFDDLAQAVIKGRDDDIKRFALMSGPLPIADVDLECAVLDNEARVLSATSVFKAFKRSRKGMNTRLEIGGTQTPPFLAAKNLKPYITQEVMDKNIPYLIF